MSIFREFPKIARLSRPCTITEKIDGTNAGVQVVHKFDIDPMAEPISALVGDYHIFAQSRNRIIHPGDDNHGFAAWVRDNADDLANLGPGTHFGEWWGSGIQRGYGLPSGERRFSLFNVGRWGEPTVADPLKRPPPACCHVVPTLCEGVFSDDAVYLALHTLRHDGSLAAPGFKNPEGIIIWHGAAQTYFKKTLCKDEEWKGKSQ